MGKTLKVKEKKKEEKEGAMELFDTSNNFMDFENIYLDVRLRKSLLYAFKFKNPTKIQSITIPHILKGKDVMFCSKTGSGKTLAYLIPTIQTLIKLNINEKEHLKFFYKCFILAPTEELCLQIYEVANQLCMYVKDLITINHNSNKTIKEYSTILISTPRELSNYITEKKKQNIDILSNLKILIIDEADVLHTEEFNKFMKKLTSNLPKSYSKKYQVIMSSATLKKSIINKSKMLLHNPTFLTSEMSTPMVFDLNKEGEIEKEKKKNSVRKKKNQQEEEEEEEKKDTNKKIPNFKGTCLYYMYDEEVSKYIILYNLLQEGTIQFKSIIYTSTIESAYKLKIFFTYINISSSVLNPNYPILVRQNVLTAFNKENFFFLICPQYDQKRFKKMKESQLTSIEQETQSNEPSERESVQSEARDNEIEESQEEEVSSSSSEAENDTKEEDKDFLFNRGLDFKDIKWVINFDMPVDVETFLHRVGRTCRMNNKGKTITFVNQEEESEIKVLANIINKKVAIMIKKDISNAELEVNRYRVESTYNKCTMRKVKLFIQKEILYQTLKSKKMREVFSSNENEKKKIKKFVKHFNTTVIPQKLIKDRNQSIFLNQKKRKLIHSNEEEKEKTDEINHIDKKNRRNKDDTKMYVLKKEGGFVLTPEAYERQLKKEPNDDDVVDPSKLQPLCGRKLRKMIFKKYVKKDLRGNKRLHTHINGVSKKKRRKMKHRNKFSRN